MNVASKNNIICLVVVMDISIFFARVLGIFLLVGGVAALINKDIYAKAVKEYARSFILVLFDASFGLLFGAIIIALHTKWAPNYIGLITFLGWIMLIEGVFAMLFPKNMQGLAKAAGKGGFVFFSFIMLLLGAYLSYVGFLL